MTKPVFLNPVAYQMLLEIAKKNHQKPDDMPNLLKTYDYLLRELSHHKRITAELEVMRAFATIDLRYQE